MSGVSGQISYSNSLIIEKRLVPGGPIVRLYKGADIDLSKWDGSDFFIPEYTKEIVITKKVAKQLEKNKITNLKLKNVTDEEINADMMDRVEERRKEMG